MLCDRICACFCSKNVCSAHLICSSLICGRFPSLWAASELVDYVCECVCLINVVVNLDNVNQHKNVTLNEYIKLKTKSATTASNRQPAKLNHWIRISYIHIIQLSVDVRTHTVSFVGKTESMKKKIQTNGRVANVNNNNNILNRILFSCSHSAGIVSVFGQRCYCITTGRTWGIRLTLEFYLLLWFQCVRVTHSFDRIKRSKLFRLLHENFVGPVNVCNSPIKIAVDVFAYM